MGVKIKNTTPEEREKQAKAMQDVAQVLTDGFVSIKETTNRHRLFCELADRKLREIAVEVFPEITDLDPEELKEFRYFFTDEVTTMSERLDLLLGTD